jgi:hypothetical protein
MDQMKKFQDVSAAELRSVEGGSWLSRAWNWVKSHIGISGHDMGGNSAVVVSVKGGWSGNP